MKYPGIKIIINELPPRKVSHDAKVQDLNKRLADLCSQTDFLSMSNQSDLRNNIERNMYDDKHIHRRAVHIFASNIKRALRKAYGLPEPKRGDTIADP